MNRLAKYLRDRGISQETFAEQIGAHQTQVSRYARYGTGAHDARRPSRRVQKAIEEATGGAVPARTWAPRRRFDPSSSHA